MPALVPAGERDRRSVSTSVMLTSQCQWLGLEFMSSDSFNIYSRAR